MPNIWTLDDEPEKPSEPASSTTISDSDDEDELDRPSFLRRLKGFTKRSEHDQSEEAGDKK